ncbi:MAG: KpsF/GutQ family sugar-phosphate isomerase [Betaproteobacteria bacterium]|nr:KpsF/GutQ family sugar-phosphate isomerase [Betaproteobacteria bacterium]
MAPASPDTPPGGADALGVARQVLEIEARALRHVMGRLDGAFSAAVAKILACNGRVVVSGLGKTGHIARKIASTLASTGTPAFFVHAAEASHGDLGMFTRDDVLLALSHSGQGAELLAIVPVIKRQGALLIAMTGNPQSSLATQADVHLYAGVEMEACPLNLAPTASTTAALALGDALAVALMRARGFTRDEFALSHPGGALGRRLLTLVRDVMRTGAAVPQVSVSVTLDEAMVEMDRGRMGMTAILDAQGGLAGVFTDGDLRRALRRGVDYHSARVADVMTRNPRTIAPDRLAAEAVQIMEHNKVNQLLVVGHDGAVTGALNMHDLFRAKVV